MGLVGGVRFDQRSVETVIPSDDRWTIDDGRMKERYWARLDALAEEVPLRFI